MRVLHLWDEFEPQWFDQSFNICKEEGIEARLLCMRLILPPGKSDEGLLYVRKIVPRGPRNSFVHRAREWLVGFSDRFRFRRAAAGEIHRFRPDILHIHYGTTAALLTVTPAAMRIPFLISFYGFDISQALLSARIRSAYYRLMRRRPFVQVLCDEARERALGFGASPERVVEANLPLPVERYPNIGVTSARISRWLIPARFVEKKGHRVLFDAFRMLIDEEPRHKLTCWGGYGDSRPLQKRIEELGLRDHVNILSNKKDGPFDQSYVAQLKKHDAVVAPSIRAKGGDDEGGPALTAVLAQVSGKPVVFSDFPGSERSVTNGVEGLVVPSNDPRALANAMKELASDPERARAMGQAGRARTIREFSRAAYRDALLRWYRQLAQ